MSKREDGFPLVKREKIRVLLYAYIEIPKGKIHSYSLTFRSLIQPFFQSTRATVRHPSCLQWAFQTPKFSSLSLSYTQQRIPFTIEFKSLGNPQKLVSRNFGKEERERANQEGEIFSPPCNLKFLDLCKSYRSWLCIPGKFEVNECQQSTFQVHANICTEYGKC